MVSLLPCSLKAGDCYVGYTREEALKQIDDVVQMIVAALIKTANLFLKMSLCPSNRLSQSLCRGYGVAPPPLSYNLRGE